MEEDLISIEKIIEMFQSASGKKMIEVTEKEYDKVMKEAVKKGYKIQKEDNSFSFLVGALLIKIVCEIDEDEDDDDLDDDGDL